MALHTQARTRGKHTKYIESKRDSKYLDRAKRHGGLLQSAAQPCAQESQRLGRALAAGNLTAASLQPRTLASGLLLHERSRIRVLDHQMYTEARGRLCAQTRAPWLPWLPHKHTRQANQTWALPAPSLCHRASKAVCTHWAAHSHATAPPLGKRQDAGLP